MKFDVQYLSFFVIQTEDASGSAKRYRHFQTLDGDDYEQSAIQAFLDDEFARICKRKAERNPSTDQPPTKIGRFIVEPGHEASSNPNYNLFRRLMAAGSRQDYLNAGDDVVRAYMETSAVRGGAFIIARAKWNQVLDDPFVFIMKCDFEPKIARISDEKSLITEVEMAISARNIKSIQYPHMPEEGMVEEGEVKIHQASHARYFEDFLKFVEYEKSIPEMLTEQVSTMVHEYMEQKWQEAETPERLQEEHSYELWMAGEKRELQEAWEPERVMEAAKSLVETKQDLELAFKLDDISVRARLADFGDKLHLAQVNGRYVVVIEGEAFRFDRGVSPVELVKPESLETVVRRIAGRKPEDEAGAKEAPPWE